MSINHPQYFLNVYRVKELEQGKEFDYEKAIAYSLGSAKETLNNFVDKLLMLCPPERPDPNDTRLYDGSMGIAYAFLRLSDRENFKQENMSKEDYLKLSLSYMESSLEKVEKMGDSVLESFEKPFLFGIGGVLAVGAGIMLATSKDTDEDSQFSKLSKWYLEASKIYKETITLSDGSDNYLHGRAGYLFGSLWLNHRAGKNVIPLEIMQDICRLIVQSGKSYAEKNSSPCPLMYLYDDTEHFGVAYGLSGILHALIQVPGFLDSDPKTEELVKESVDYLLSCQTPVGDFPRTSNELGLLREDKDEVSMYWYNGASGVIYLMAAAYLRWKDQRYLDSCLKIGELLWERGIIESGQGICRGVAGIGYVFLLLYRLTSDRVHYFRAAKFAELLNQPLFRFLIKKPSRETRYSLYEGLSGLFCFLSDVLDPQKAYFPFQDVFYSESKLNLK